MDQYTKVKEESAPARAVSEMSVWMETPGQILDPLETFGVIVGSGKSVDHP